MKKLTKEQIEIMIEATRKLFNAGELITVTTFYHPTIHLDNLRAALESLGEEEEHDNECIHKFEDVGARNNQLECIHCGITKNISNPKNPE